MIRSGGEDASQHGGSALSLSSVHVQMSYAAERARAHRADQHVLLAHPRRKLRRGCLRVERDDVRGHGGTAQGRAGTPANRFGDDPRILVILSQPRKVVIEGVETGRGDDSRLAHAAAETLAPPSDQLHRDCVA